MAVWVSSSVGGLLFIWGTVVGMDIVGTLIATT